MKKILILLVVLSYSTIGICQFDLVITKQNTLNTLQYYPNVYKNIILTSTPGQDSSTMITDLTPFLGVDSVFGDITIENTAIASLNGLQEIEYMGDLIIYNNALLKDASNFQAPKFVMDLEFYQNPELTAISGLKTIQHSSSIRIESNPKLISVDLVFESLLNENQGFYVEIVGNNLLETLFVNDPLKSMRGFWVSGNSNLNQFHVRESNDSLWSNVIENNSLLTKVTGFQSVVWFGPTRIENNVSLNNLCALREAIENGYFTILVLADNASGANSEAEILATDCSDFNTGLNELNAENNLKTYPNPAHDEVYVGVPENTRYTIYSVAGKLVQHGNVETSGRIGLSSLPNGLYVLQIENSRSKLVVQ